MCKRCLTHGAGGIVRRRAWIVLLPALPVVLRAAVHVVPGNIVDAGEAREAAVGAEDAEGEFLLAPVFRSGEAARRHGDDAGRRDALDQAVAFANMSATTDRAIDLLDGDLYAGDPYPTYAWMREQAPVYWDAQNELWGIARYDDIVEIEKAKDVFINSDRAKGGYRPNLPSDPSIIGLDDPIEFEPDPELMRRIHARLLN